MFLAFAPGLGGDFTNWDDDWLVVDNPWIKEVDGASISTILNPWVPERIRNQLGAEYLPLRDLSYMADDALHGLHPAGYHLSNLLIHILGVLALAAAVWRFTRLPLLAIGTAAVFGLHPVQVECVTWIAGRKDVLAGLCGALGALCWARAREQRDGENGFPTAAYAGSLVFVLAAVGSKYTAMVWPAMLLVAELLTPPRAGLRGTRFRRAALLVPHLVLVVAFVAGIAVPVASRGLLREGFYGSGYGATFATAGVVICSYWRTIALPYPLQTAIDFPVYGDSEPVIAWTAAVLVLLTLGAAIGLGAGLLRRDPVRAHGPRAAAVAVLVFLGALFPMSNVVNAIGTLYAERYLYLSMIGVGIAAGALAQWAWSRRAGAGTAVLAGLGVLGVVWGGTTAGRAPAWDGSVSIWEDVLSKDPVHHTAHFNLGNHWFVQATKLRGAARGELLSLAEANQRLAVHERHRSFYSIAERAEAALALTLAAQGKLDGEDGARAWYERALESTRTAVAAMPPESRDRGPRERFMAEIYIGRGQVHQQMGRADAALRDFRLALKLRPDLAVAHLNVGIMLGRRAGSDERTLDDAVGHLQEAIALQPRNVEALLNLVALYLQRRRPAKALATTEEALRVAPRSVEARFYRGIVLGNTGRTPEARALFESMVTEADPLARGAGALGLGTVYEQEGDIRSALAAYFAATRDPILQRSVALGGVKVRLRGVMMEQAEHIWKNDALDIIEKQEQMLQFLEVAAQMGSESAVESGRNAAYNLGSRAYNKGTPEELEKAIGYFKRCATIDPESAKAYLGLAAVARKQGDPHGVAAALSEALQIEKASDEAREEIVYQAAGFEAARALLIWNDGNGDMAEVREALGNAERLDPKHRSLLQIRAQIESTDERGDFGVALQASETLAKLEEHGNDELQLLVRIFSVAGSTEQVPDAAARGTYLRAAIAFALQLITKNPTNAGLYRNVANLYKGVHQYNNAIGAFEAGLKIDAKDQQMAADCAELLRRRGLLHYSKKRTADARRDLERAFTLATVGRESFAWKVLAELRGSDVVPPEVVRLMAEARALLADAKPAYARMKALEAGRLQRSRGLFLLMGDISMALHKPQEAAEFWADAAREMWDDELVVKIGNVLWDDGRWEAAVDTVQTLYGRLLDKQDGELAKAWITTRGGELAKLSLDEGTKLLSEIGGGEAKPDPEKLADAESAFRLAITLRADDPRGHFGLARTLERAGAKAKAAESYTQVIALTTDDAAGAAKSLHAAATTALQRLSK